MKKCFTLTMLRLMNYDVHCNHFTILLDVVKIHDFGVLKLHNTNNCDYMTHIRNNSFIIFKHTCLNINLDLL